MLYNVPHGEEFEIDTIVLDLNGTLSVNGKVPTGVKLRINQLKQQGFKIILFTGDQRGTASKLCKELGIEHRITSTGADKEREMLKLNGKKCAAIGNARIDIGTFKHAKLSILTLQAEGIHVDAIKHAHLIVPSIIDALDLFLNPNSLCATLRK
ncbi:MAG: HAD hydrolase family protein [Candidatus Woesearchaeota archaeon]|jgi:soluble P-type ATPase